MRSAPLGYLTLGLAAVSLYQSGQSAGMSILISVIGFFIVFIYWAERRQSRARTFTASARQQYQSASPPPPPSWEQTTRAASSPPPTIPKTPPPPPPPTTAPNTEHLIGGRYRVKRILGAGGMKRVYLVEDTRLNDRRCAMAELLDAATDPAQQAANRQAFEHEARMLLNLSNKHIPEIYDRFSEGNVHYLVMEFVDGATLEAMAGGAGGRVGEATVSEIAIQILDALIYLHGHRPPIIFRDHKPENVMVTSDGGVKLVDFGIARNFTTAKATSIGTPGYAAPEQWGGAVDPRADLYALGAVMHRMLSGQVPETLQKFAPIASLCPGIDARLAALIDSALSVKAEKRPQTAAAMLIELKQLRANHTTKPVTGAASNRRSPVRFCAQCGTALTPRSRKCSQCGTPRYA